MEQTSDTEQTKKKRANSVLKTSSSLIPIKGISSKMQAKLAALKIYDIPSLLSRCKDQSKRDKLAEDLEISPEHVNSWVKQGDLWRVEGMTTDTAYMLVLIGVRCVSDLSKVDPDKTYPILKSVSLSHPDFVLVTKEELVSLISSAEALNHSTVNLDYLINNIKEIISCQDIPNDFKDQVLYNSIDSNEYQFIEEEPKYLFKSISDHTEGNLANKLSAAWKDLFEYDCTLPLPKTISGTIKKRSIISNSQPTPFIGVKVEIDGVVSPAEDKTEAIKNPSCITDTTGHFIITLPERYNFKETVKIIISNARGKQEFIKNSADVISAVEENDIVNALQNILATRIAYRTTTYINSSITEEQPDLQKEFIKAVDELVDKESKFKEKLEKLKNKGKEKFNDLKTKTKEKLNFTDKKLSESAKTGIKATVAVVAAVSIIILCAKACSKNNNNGLTSDEPTTSHSDGLLDPTLDASIPEKYQNPSYIQDIKNAYNLTDEEAYDLINRAYKIYQSGFYGEVPLNQIIQVLDAINDQDINRVENAALDQSINAALTEIYNHYAYGKIVEADLNKVNALEYFARDNTELDKILETYQGLLYNLLASQGDAAKTEAARNAILEFLEVFANSRAGFVPEDTTLSTESIAKYPSANITDPFQWGIFWESFCKPMFSAFISQGRINEWICLQENILSAYEQWVKIYLCEDTTLTLGK